MRKEPPRGAVRQLAEIDVTVSIVNHQNRERILDCLQSLKRDPERHSSVEIVVLDNASRDGSVDAMRAGHLDVRVIAQQHRAGFGANHNTIIRRTSGDYVFVLNDDTRVPPSTIDVLKTFLDARPKVGIVGPRLRYENGAPMDSAWRFPTPATCALFALTLGQVGVVQSRTNKARRVDWLGGAAFMVRRNALEEVGFFDEAFFMYMEETDLCRRLLNAGYEAWYLPEVEVVHHGWGSTSGMDEHRINELWRSRRYYWAKHHTPAGARVALTFDWIRYSLGANVASALAHLPRRFRPTGVDADSRRRLRLNARVLRKGPTGAGFRELAEEANREMRPST